MTNPRNLIAMTALTVFSLAAHQAVASPAHRASAAVMERVGEHNEGVGSGEFGARAGILLYNRLHPNAPLPVSSGNVVSDTFRNAGAGQSWGQAWSNAARENAGVENKPESAPPAQVEQAPAPLEEDPE